MTNPFPYAAPATPDDDDPPPRGTRRWLVACDESGTGGATHYGFGSVWMPWQRRGDFQEEMRAIAAKRSYPLLEREMKWNKAQDKFLPFYLGVIDHFFESPYLCFHCIVVRKGVVDRSRHRGDWDLARRKHFTRLLTNKIERCIRKRPAEEQTFRIWVDPIASRYAKAHEAVEVISNNVLASALGEVRPVDRVILRSSHDTLQIQLCDLLLGAVMEAWLGNAERAAKRAVQSAIAARLGWPDLRADTRPGEKKFNIWYFNPHGRMRDVVTRAVRVTPRADRRLVIVRDGSPCIRWRAVFPINSAGQARRS